MNKNIKSVLLTYVEGAMDNGKILENVIIGRDYESGMYEFSGKYSKSIAAGYLHNDRGVIEKGQIRYTEANGVKTVSLKANYDGVKDGAPYNYTQAVSIQMFANGLVYKVSTDSRSKDVKETYYKMVPCDYLVQYNSACSNTIKLEEGDHKIRKSA